LSLLCKREHALYSLLELPELVRSVTADLLLSHFTGELSLVKGDNRARDLVLDVDREIVHSFSRSLDMELGPHLMVFSDHQREETVGGLSQPIRSVTVLFAPKGTHIRMGMKPKPDLFLLLNEASCLLVHYLTMDLVTHLLGDIELRDCDYSPFGNLDVTQGQPLTVLLG